MWIEALQRRSACRFRSYSRRRVHISAPPGAPSPTTRLALHPPRVALQPTPQPAVLPPPQEKKGPWSPKATGGSSLKSFDVEGRVEPECFRQLRRSRLLLRTQVCCTAIAVVFAPLAALVAVVTAAAHHTNTVLQHECNSPRTLMQSCCLLDFVPFSVWVPIRSGCEDGFEAYSPSPSSAACDPASIKCCLEAHPSPKPKT